MKAWTMVWVLVAAAINAPAPSVRDQTPAGRGWHIAFRVDDTRVAMIFTGGEMYMPQRAFEALLDASALRTRTATLGRLTEVPADRVRDIVGDRARIGDRWVLDAGRHGRFPLTVERLVLGYRDCGEGWGVIATVAASEAARFAAISDTYFAARLDDGGGATVSGAVMGAVPFAIDAVRRAQLSAVLNDARQRAWPEIRRDADVEYARQEARGRTEPARWRALDARLERGEGTIEFDVQAFRLTPDGDPRLFVRARWMIEKTVVFAMTAWVRAADTLSIDEVNVTPSRRLRISQFLAESTDVAFLGRVLAVLDTDADGIGEVLVSLHGYESVNLMLSEYSPTPRSPRREIAVYTNGC